MEGFILGGVLTAWDQNKTANATHFSIIDYSISCISEAGPVYKVVLQINHPWYIDFWEDLDLSSCLLNLIHLLIH